MLKPQSIVSRIAAKGGGNTMKSNTNSDVISASMEIITTDRECRYVLKRNNGDVLELNYGEVMAIRDALDKQTRYEDLHLFLENNQNEDGSYWIQNNTSVELSEDEVEQLVLAAMDEYEELQSNDGSWRDLAEEALGSALESIEVKGAA